MQTRNDTFAEFAAAFTGEIRDAHDIAYPAQIHRPALDYTIESLKRVDVYLDFLHARQREWRSPEWVNTVLWGGAYMGETIRRHAPRRYDWVNFDDFVVENPEVRELIGPQKSLPVWAFLTPGGGGFTLPLNKVVRHINDGDVESVWFYADCEVRA